MAESIAGRAAGDARAGYDCAMRRVRLVLGLALLVAGALLASCGSDAPRGAVHVSKLADDIGPVSANFIDRAISKAEDEGAALWILQLDTPGGLLSSTDQIVQRLLAAEVPTAVFVSPAGARAASAGTFITMAAHIAAMAPNTQIGAAHPVAGGENLEGDIRDKVTNDAAADIRGIAAVRGRNEDWAESAVRESVSVTGEEAVELDVVDLTARNVEDLLNRIDGRPVQVSAEGEPVVLDLATAAVIESNFSLSERILNVIADPNFAFIMINIGGLLLLVEAWSPGLVGPGIFGVILLVFGFFALGPLDTNPAGITLLVIGLGLLAVEVFVAGFGVFGIGGIISILLGGLLLIGDPSIDAPSVSLWALAVVGIIAGAIVGGIGLLLLNDRRKPPGGKTWTGGRIIGQDGVAHNAISPEGTVVVASELWSARSSGGPIPKGAPVRVLEMDGMTAVVEATIPIPVEESAALGDGAVREG